jgi:hypothetical protein
MAESDLRSQFTVKLLSPEIGETAIGNENIVLFEMIEDIFSICMVAKLIFIDVIGAVELFPITGNEFISITYGEGNVSKLFVVYDFKKIHQGIDQYGSSMNTIEMYLVEPFHLALTQHKFSLSWKNKLISDIVKNIGMNMLGIEFKTFENSNEKLEYFYMPYWTPLEALKWLIPRASGINSGMPGYLFYSNTQGKHFHTLESIFQSKNYERDPDTGRIAAYKFVDTENLLSIYRVLSWSIEPIDYQSLAYLSGGHKFGYDFTTKEFLDFQYEYEDIISKYTLMGKKTLFFNISNTTSQFTFDGDNDIKILQNIAYHEFITRYSKQFAVLLTVRGSSTRFAGMIIDIPWASTAGKEILHKLYQGKFLVKSITHQFSGRIQPTYRQLLVTIKTGYNEADTDKLHKATKYDIVVPSK